MTNPSTPSGEVALLPCGNCGADARWVEFAWRVKCTRSSCGVQGGKFELRTDAFTAWNTRLQPQDTAAISYAERLEYEEHILALEMDIERLKKAEEPIYAGLTAREIGMGTYHPGDEA